MSKNKKIKQWVYKIIIVLLCCVIGFCLYKISGIIYEYYVGAKAYENVQEIAGIEKDKFGKIDFETLAKENPDIRAWLHSNDTIINYPVVQGKDNEFYLYRMFNKEWNGKGSLFVDARCENPFKDFNTIIYGHRMKDGSMFHSLIKYREEDFYKQHKTMDLITPDKAYKLRIFSVMTIPADSDLYRFDFFGEEDKNSYIRNIKNQSETKMDDVEVTAEDKLVMLSTCTYEFDNARLVVFGKLEEVN